MPKTVSITIKKGGKQVVEAHGFQGPTCEQRVQFYASKLGGKQTDVQNKPEYYEQPASEQDQANQ